MTVSPEAENVSVEVCSRRPSSHHHATSTVSQSYLGDWSEEIFEISTGLPTVPVTYELRDLLGESIKGRFYEPEIQRVLKSDDERFVVDRIVKTRKRDGKIQYLVSWKGYPSKFESWVDELATI